MGTLHKPLHRRKRRLRGLCKNYFRFWRERHRARCEALAIQVHPDSAALTDADLARESAAGSMLSFEELVHRHETGVYFIPSTPACGR